MAETLIRERASNKLREMVADSIIGRMEDLGINIGELSRETSHEMGIGASAIKGIIGDIRTGHFMTVGSMQKSREVRLYRTGVILYHLGFKEESGVVKAIKREYPMFVYPPVAD